MAGRLVVPSVIAFPKITRSFPCDKTTPPASLPAVFVAQLVVG